jgi:hypothetical protein
MGKGPPGLKSAEGQMTHDSRGKVAPEDDITGEGSTSVKLGAAKEDGIMRASLIWALGSQPLGSCASDSGPPPGLKVERQGGSGISLSVVDPGTPIKTVEDMGL